MNSPLEALAHTLARMEMERAGLVDRLYQQQQEIERLQQLVTTLTPQPDPVPAASPTPDTLTP